jgi:hypothetical protein
MPHGGDGRTGLNATLLSGENFEIVTGGTNFAIRPQPNLITHEIYVRPNAGLPVGRHTDTVVITDGDG